MSKFKMMTRFAIVTGMLVIALLGGVLVASAQDGMDEGDGTTDTTDATTETTTGDAEQVDDTDDDLVAVPISVTDFANQTFNEFFFSLTEREQNLVRAVESGLVPGAGPGERVCAIFEVEGFSTMTPTPED